MVVGRTARILELAQCALLGLGGTACFGMPNPLAPSLGGSVGVPHRGVLTEAVALPQRGDGFRRLRKNDVRWGNPRLIGSIERAAARVAKERPGGARLLVADISAKSGGRIPRHRSHRTGRDADLLFFALRADGRSVASPGFVHYRSDGFAEHDKGAFVRFDVARNWLLVRALVTDPEASIQYLFVARWLEALLIEYAIAADADPEVVWRAELVLRQPGDSAPHDDHFHIRIACTPAEMAGGCEGGGPQRPWLPLPQPTAITDGHILAALFDGLAEPVDTTKRAPR